MMQALVKQRAVRVAGPPLHGPEMKRWGGRVLVLQRHRRCGRPTHMVAVLRNTQQIVDPGDPAVAVGQGARPAFRSFARPPSCAHRLAEILQR